MDNYPSSLDQRPGAGSDTNTRSDIFNLGVRRGDAATDTDDAGVSPLEQEVLEEYERLVGNMRKVSFRDFVSCCLLFLYEGELGVRRCFYFWTASADLLLWS